MRLRLSPGLLALLPAVLAAQPAAAQGARGSVYLSVMGEPFIAPSGQAPLGLWLARADTDRSGSISPAEMTADAEVFFKRLDFDKDGRIGGFEMTRYEEEIAPASVRAAAGVRPVKSRDREDNGLTAVSEARTERERANKKGRDSLPGGMTGPKLSMEGLQPYEKESKGVAALPQPVAMTDTDFSGSVTPEEFARAAARRFAILDLNKSGLLEVGELVARR
jgi:hypothetical protein